MAAEAAVPMAAAVAAASLAPASSVGRRATSVATVSAGVLLLPGPILLSKPRRLFTGCLPVS